MICDNAAIWYRSMSCLTQLHVVCFLSNSEELAQAIIAEQQYIVSEPETPVAEAGVVVQSLAKLTQSIPLPDK